MASGGGADGRWLGDPVALVLGVVALAGIVGEVALAVMGKQVPGALDSVLYVCGGALAGALGINRRSNGDGDRRESSPAAK